MDRIIPVAEPWITDREVGYVLSAVKSGWVSSLGEYLVAFEAAFARYIGTEYAVSTTNGTAALHLALATLGIAAGDEVIVPDLTFVATANAVTYTGATPVFVDIDPDTWCIDPEAVRKQLTRKTKAIVPVHLYGHPADLDAVRAISNDKGLYVVEDAAEAHGAEYKGYKVGGIGDLGVFSFYGNKIMTTGEGGMIVTNNREHYQKARYLRDHGMESNRKYWHEAIGYNYRMTNIQAALGLAQLERIDELLSKRSQIFGWYREMLGVANGLSLNPKMSWAKPVCWMVCALLEKGNQISRDGIQAKLLTKGIETRPFFYPLTSLPIYSGAQGMPNARSIASRGFILPSSPSLKFEEVEYITNAVKSLL